MNTMVTALSTIGYVVAFFFFGWECARFVLRENRIEYLLAFSGLFGIGFYTFFLNVAATFGDLTVYRTTWPTP